MGDDLEALEEQILVEYAELVRQVQPELEKYWFYDIMPSWEDYKEYRIQELRGHP